MKISPFVAIWAICLSLSSCVQEAAVPSYSLEPEQVVNQLGDSLYLSPQISCIDHRNGKTYISDYRQGLMVLRADFCLDTILATQGHGRGEVNGCGSFYLDDVQTLTLLDDMNRRYVHFLPNGTFVTDRNSGMDYISTGRFFTVGDTVYNAIKKNENTVVQLKDGVSVKTLCPLTDREDIRQPAPSERHLLWTGSTFLVLGTALPILQEYTLSGQLVQDFDLSTLPQLAGPFEYNSQNATGNSYFVVIQDAYYREGFLYLLSATQEPYLCNHISVLKKTDHQFKVFANIQLSGKAYSTFCITADRKCLAVNAQTSAIEVYPLPNF